jgi:argininosuccinate lyase
VADEYLGEGGRLTGGPAAELVAAGYAAEVAHGPRLARALSLADLAHAVALAESGSLPDDRAAALVEGLLELHAIPPEEFPWRPELGDAFNSREALLNERVGKRAAGWLSAGRPRREAFRVALRLVARDGARALHDATLDLAEAMLAHAARLPHDLAADYTYLQPAQPTTVGHLLLSYVQPFLRDAERLRELHAGLDLNVAGAGGSAGSRWPLDRERLGELLGCTGQVAHVRDAMWQTDPYLELLAAVAIGAGHQSQMAQDFEILASQEFGVISLADRHSRASALMPQKRNPYALAVIREAAGAATGDLAGTLTTLHTGSARTDHFHALNGVVPRRLEQARATTILAARVVAGMDIDAGRMARAARRGFTVAADVADLLAQSTELDYRSAHTVVGRAVRRRAERGLPLEEITGEEIADAAREAGLPVRLEAEALAAALDPLACAHGRLQQGSSAPHEVDLLIAEAQSAIGAGREWSSAAENRVEVALDGLVGRARELAG